MDAMNCVNCGAALPPRSDICTYCQTRNDTDLRRFDVKPGEESDRSCARCRVQMDTVTVQIHGNLHVERCHDCFGIFFDRDELEDLLEQAVNDPHNVDYQRLASLAEEKPPSEFSSTYVPCPVCGEIMNPRSYGVRSGVVAHTCKEDGVWLDGGALGQLLRWAKVGGRLQSGGRVDVLGDPDAATGEQGSGARRTSQRSTDRERGVLESLNTLETRRSRSGGDLLGDAVAEAVTDVLGFLARIVLR